MAETKKKTTSAKSSGASKSGTRSRRTKADTQAQKAAAALKQEQLRKKKQIHDDISAIVIIVVGVFLLFSMQFGSGGSVGDFITKVMFGLFGIVGYAIPYFFILFGILVFARKTALLTFRTWLCVAVLFLSVSCLNASRFAGVLSTENIFSFPVIKDLFTLGVSSGGILGMIPALILLRAVQRMGLYLTCGALIIISLMFIFNTPISAFLDNLKLKAAANKAAREEMELAALQYEAEHAEEEAEPAPAAAAVLPVRKKKAVAVSYDDIQGEPATKTEAEKPARKETPLPEPVKYTEPEEPEQPEPEIIAEPEEPVPVREYTPEDIGLVSADSVDVYTPNQQHILEYVRDDDLFGISKSDSGTLGLTGMSPEEAQKHGSEPVDEDPPKPAEQKAPAEEKPVQKPAEAPETESEEAKKPGYTFPPVSLLGKAATSKAGGKVSDLQAQAELLESTLKSFNVNASVIDYVKGPAVTRFEVQPASGVKVSSIVRLQDDIALNLKAKSLRIEAPIPGKAAVGIEISNDSINTITLREIVESKEFRDAKSRISMCLGRSITGDAIVGNLKDMPHMLIAGATGSGKSVCINSIIVSLLYKAKPDEVKLILIDPKVVELSNYNGIPHLMVPVVTDPPKASAALGWAVGEMNDRYQKFAEEGVRDLESYNETMRANGEEEKVLPQVVIIIDELADLIMAAQNTVEDSICRLAQKARAAGMHLIVATQRPSVDIITGVIKANIPSRIAFAVSAAVDSRTILDMTGAEKLLGKGDMLYLPQGISKPIRVQGCFVSDQQVNAVIDFIKKGCEKPEYAQNVLSAMDRAGAGPAASADDGDDDLYADAVEHVVKAKQASVSSLQRRFRIGYNRAARLIDMMEERGIVGPADGAKPRKVLMTEEMYFETAENAIEVPEEF